MKLKKFKFKQILKLHLLNSRVYEHAVKKNSSGFLTDFKLIQIVSDFKKVLHIIFEYHQANKQILFVGVPNTLELKINRLTHHTAVDTDFELQAIISNNLKVINSLKNAKLSATKSYAKLLMPKLLKKPDLIVLLSHEKKQNIIAESNVAKIPVVVFDSDWNIPSNSFRGSYNLKGFGGSSISEKNLFFLGLNFLFKQFKQIN
jgi:hypothetical protein